MNHDMIPKLNIAAERGSYEVLFGSGLLKDVGKIFDLRRKVLVVTDSGVPSCYSKTVCEQAKEGFTEVIPAGEASKSFEKLEKLLVRMLNEGFTREDCVVSVGGGVTGDLSGFAASCYMRGIDFYQIPTTILSAADASVGGKTAVDLSGVKNAAGAFYMPKGVLIDTDLFETLDVRQTASGFAEIIKMALTCDKELFEFLENSCSQKQNLDEILYRAVRIKKEIVEQDPEEKGLRRVLNFGHTIGHAVESAAKGKLLHGECVSIGMIPMCAPDLQPRVIKVLEKYGLPVRSGIPASELKPYLIHDKKRMQTYYRTVYVPEPGRYEFRDLTLEEILKEAEKTV